MINTVTDADILVLLRADVERVGSIRKYATFRGVSPSYIVDLVGAKDQPDATVRRPISDTVAGWFGYERVVHPKEWQRATTKMPKGPAGDAGQVGWMGGDAIP